MYIHIDTQTQYTFKLTNGIRTSLNNYQLGDY